MTADHQKKSYNMFTLILGLLVVFAILFIVLGRLTGKKPAAAIQADPAAQAAVAERLAPVAKLAIAGQDNTALATPDRGGEPAEVGEDQPAQQSPAPSAEPPPAAAQQAATSSKEPAGKAVYDMACSACHGGGIAGAPKHGDVAAWAPRIAKGMATLHKHALEGFHGDAGFMPAKGGRVDLSDQVVMDAVDYMVATSK